MRTAKRLACVFMLAYALNAQIEGLHDAANVGPTVGAIASEFTLTDQFGRPRTLQSLMGPKGLALVFFRSADWCIYCKGQLVQLQHEAAELQKTGIALAAISYDSPAVLQDFAKRKSITFPLLSDHESTVIRQYGLADRHYRQGIQLDIANERITTSMLGNIPVYGISYPAIFLLAPDRRVNWRFVSEGSELRFTLSSILEHSVGAIADQTRIPVQSRNVEVTATSTNDTIGLGNRFRIALELRIPPGSHVYGPNVQGGYRGVDWQMDPTSCLVIADPVYPEAERKLMKSTQETLPVYEGTLRITRDIILKPAIKAADPSVYSLFRKLCVDSDSSIKISGVMKFQACDEQRCYPPQSVQPRWKFKFTAPDLERSPEELRREFELK